MRTIANTQQPHRGSLRAAERVRELGGLLQNEFASIYASRLKTIGGMIFPAVRRPGINYEYFVVLIDRDQAHVFRDDLYNGLKAFNVFTLFLKEIQRGSNRVESWLGQIAELERTQRVHDDGQAERAPHWLV